MLQDEETDMCTTKTSDVSEDCATSSTVMTQIQPSQLVLPPVSDSTSESQSARQLPPTSIPDSTVCITPSTFLLSQKLQHPLRREKEEKRSNSDANR